MEENLHSGHRERMRKRVLDFGTANMSDHEILEIMLYFVIPRKNTNELAHILLKSFGSLSCVIDAPYSELIKIKGLSHNAAFFFCFFHDLQLAYRNDSYRLSRSLCRGKLNSISDVIAIFRGHFAKCFNECISLIIVNNKNEVVFSGIIKEGDEASVQIETRVLVQIILQYNCNRVILAHNHPSGNAIPSAEDYKCAEELQNILSVMNISLIDFLIVTPNDYYSFASQDCSHENDTTGEKPYL